MGRFGWVVAVISMALFGIARPRATSMFDRMMDSSDPAAGWNSGLLRLALALNVIAVLSALVAIVLNIGRGRETEQVLPSILILLCIVGLLVMVPLVTG